MDGSTWIEFTTPSRRLASPLGWFVRLLRRWHARARERRLLARFDDPLLADVGITRLDQARECEKPFWRA